MTSKYDGLILEGRWSFKEYTKNKMIVLENIFNHRTIILSHRQLLSVLDGKDTIGHIMTRRISDNRPNDNIFIYGNGVIKSMKLQQHKYATKK